MRAPTSPLQHHKEALEARLEAILPASDSRLHRAMRHAVLGPGKRFRPRFLLAVAASCGAGEQEMRLALDAACALELIHAASLVHDDLPCFDDAALRRGQPTVHVLFGEPLAVLVGDALLTRAFELLAEAPDSLASRALKISRLFGRATGAAEGIIGGQSLELDEDFWPKGQGGARSFPQDKLDRYHTMKTAALFWVATEAGAVAAGAPEPERWAKLGYQAGLAFQITDDLFDAIGHSETEGKPVQRDSANDRPNAVLLWGEAASRQRLMGLVSNVHQLATELAQEQQPILSLLEELESQIQRMIKAA